MDSTQRKLDRWLAAPMFVASVVFLLLLAGALHLRVDVETPEVSEQETVVAAAETPGAESSENVNLRSDNPSPITPTVSSVDMKTSAVHAVGAVTASSAKDPERFSNLYLYCEWGLLLLYPLFFLEFLVHRLVGSPFWKRDLLSCLLPPFRLVAHDHESGNNIYLPSYGWQELNAGFRERLTTAFNVPMILIALMVLPLLACDFKWQAEIQSSPILSMLTQLSESLIWFAFTLEFLVMISIVERKGQYCKQHWMDIAIILLPIVAFLRAARLGRLLRLQQFTKTAKLTRTARVYRLRGLAMRAYRAILVLEVIQRLMHRNPEKRLETLKEQLAQMELDMDDLKSQIAALEESIEPSAAAEPQLAAQQAIAEQRVA